MARCPFAEQRILHPENEAQPRIAPRVAILHTAVDSPSASSLGPYFDSETVSLESTFFVKFDGTIEQYMDTEVRADANRYANTFAVSIETEDDGDPSIPWTAAQLASIIRLLRWLNQVHPAIRLAKCDGPYGSGIGWHSMWGAPSAWTPYAGKTCPGAVRIEQINRVILPILAGGGFLMALTDEQQVDLYQRMALVLEVVGRLEAHAVAVDAKLDALTQPAPASVKIEGTFKSV